MEVTAIRSVNENAAQSRMDRENALRNGGKTMRLHFACDIHQTDNQTIEIIVHPGPDPFTTVFRESVCDAMGTIRGEQYLEELLLDINKRAVLDGVTVR